MIGLLPYATKMQDYVFKGEAPNQMRLHETDYVIRACARRSQAMQELAVKLESLEFGVRKSEAFAKIRANIDRMEAVANMLTKDGDGTPAVDPVQVMDLVQARTWSWTWS